MTSIVDYMTIIYVALAALVGYLIGRSTRTVDTSTVALHLDHIDSALEEINSVLTELTKALCGDKGLEKAIQETNEVGATLTEEMLVYEGGYLDRIETLGRELAHQVGRLADALAQREKSKS